MLLFAGDPHGEFEHLYPILQEIGGSVSLVILGDLQIKSAQELEKLATLCDLWFIHGNHDSKTAASFQALWGSEWHGRNLHARVQEIEGVRIAGLGGVFRGQVWMPPNKPLYFDPIHFCQYCPPEKIWRGGVPLRHRSSIFPSDLEVLETQKADILVCHEAPRPHPSGFVVLNKLAEKMGVRKIFHGHHHDNFDYNKTRHNMNTYAIFNIGFRSLSDINGHYLLVGIDDRE